MGKKTSDRANRKGQVDLTMRCESRLRRIVRSQRSQTLVQITTQLRDSASRTEQGVKGHHTTLRHFFELWTTLANIWQDIPVGRFQKLVEYMPCRVAAVINARGGSTRY
ncbi:hypothetical protein TNCV_3287971 [Trichonephila clavipes]|nr:hypothetical protein TNCV_3287971 [Trichonephila clavipes]